VKKIITFLCFTVLFVAPIATSAFNGIPVLRSSDINSTTSYRLTVRERARIRAKLRRQIIEERTDEWEQQAVKKEPRRYTIPITKKDDPCVNLRGILLAKCKHLQNQKEVLQAKRERRVARPKQYYFRLPSTVERSYDRKVHTRMRSLERLQVEKGMEAEQPN